VVAVEEADRQVGGLQRRGVVPQEGQHLEELLQEGWHQEELSQHLEELLQGVQLQEETIQEELLREVQLQEGLHQEEMLQEVHHLGLHLEWVLLGKERTHPQFPPLDLFQQIR